MNKGIFVVVAILVIAVLVIAVTIASDSGDTWDTPWTPEDGTGGGNDTGAGGILDGTWMEGITIGYTDGTTQELKLIQDGDGSWPFAVEYNGKEIDYISYYVKGRVTDLGGFDSVKVDAGSLGVKWMLLKYYLQFFFAQHQIIR